MQGAHLTVQSITYDPYCGPAPLPADLWAAWNLDPVLILAMLASFLAWRVAGRRDRVGLRANLGAQLLIALAFVSPLCALSSALFSARVAHHLVLIGGIAPLLAIAFPWRRGPMLPLSALVIGHATIVWLWHAPGPYGFALSSHAAYWLMQATLGISAWALWRGVLSPFARNGRGAFALLATIMQMGFLGALLVFAPQPVFAPHFGTTAPFGLSPLTDQQLAGLLMWVPAFVPYAGVAIWQLAGSLLPRVPRPAQ
ncbi:cytochrome c oxidase assembly protein [Pelagibacterium montanilacus]|uniref:cytochrome c oxidase assembly protein n=1 Tax=Pelagibacterium montanilacus TaxID=2185280 RepID=UPI001FE7B76A|nr:cytochrome c oxidase assembly protein [Pelagibacterium montanilacus]